MYVINGIPEFRKMGTGIPIFDLNGFRVFRFDFPPESSGIPNSEAEFRIPVVPGNGISKRNSQPSSNSGSDVPMGNWTTSCGEKVVQGVRRIRDHGGEE
jgi:hypothetical protein